MTEGEFVNANGDPVSWDALDEAERAFYSDPSPWEVVEYEMSVQEYVLKWHRDAALHEFYFEPANGWYPTSLSATREVGPLRDFSGKAPAAV